MFPYSPAILGYPQVAHLWKPHCQIVEKQMVPNGWTWMAPAARIDFTSTRTLVYHRNGAFRWYKRPEMGDTLDDIYWYLILIWYVQVIYPKPPLDDPILDIRGSFRIGGGITLSSLGYFALIDRQFPVINGMIWCVTFQSMIVSQLSIAFKRSLLDCNIIPVPIIKGLTCVFLSLCRIPLASFFCPQDVDKSPAICGSLVLLQKTPQNCKYFKILAYSLLTHSWTVSNCTSGI